MKRKRLVFLSCAILLLFMIIVLNGRIKTADAKVEFSNKKETAVDQFSEPEEADLENPKKIIQEKDNRKEQSSHVYTEEEEKTYSNLPYSEEKSPDVLQLK